MIRVDQVQDGGIRRLALQKLSKAQAPCSRVLLIEISGVRALIKIVKIGETSFVDIYEITSEFVGRPGSTGFNLSDKAKGKVVSFDTKQAHLEDNDYGNLGGEISWKGPAGVLVPYDPLVNYGEAVTVDEVIGGLLDEKTLYTPFTANLYQDGTLLETLKVGAAPKILCYGEVQGEDRVVIGSNYRGLVNPDKGSGGFYEELYASRDGWQRIAYRSSSRPKLPCSFLTDGRVLTQEGVYTPEGEFAKFGKATGTRNAGAGWHRNGTVEDSLFRFGDEIESYPSTYHIFDRTTDVKEGGSTTATAGIFIPNPETLTIANHGVSVGNCYSASGGVPPYIWSGVNIDPASGCIQAIPGCSATVFDSCGSTASYTPTPGTPLTVVGPDAYALSGDYSATGGTAPYTFTFPTGCGMQSVTVTDACGLTASKAVRMASGVWSQVSECNGLACTCSAPCNNVFYSGALRYVTTAHCCRSSETSCIAQYCGTFDASIVSPGGCAELINNCVGNWSPGDPAIKYFTYKQVATWVCP